MKRKQELVSEAIKRFGQGTLDERFFVDKTALVPSLVEHDVAMWIVNRREMRIGISHDKKLLGNSLGFRYKVEKECEVLSYDGEWIFFDGIWADVRKPTKEELKEVVEMEQKIVEENFQRIKSKHR